MSIIDQSVKVFQQVDEAFNGTGGNVSCKFMSYLEEII